MGEEGLAVDRQLDRAIRTWTGRDILKREDAFILVHEIHCGDLFLDDILPEDGFTRLRQAKNGLWAERRTVRNPEAIQC